MKNRLQDCTVCNEIEGIIKGFPSDYSDIIKKQKNIISETQNFCVLASIGPLNEYHLIIVPKEHYSAIALLSDKMLDELEILKKSLNEFNKQQFNLETVYFEHGSCVKTQFDSSCIDHAHLHSLALTNTLYIYLKQLVNLNPINFKDIKKLENTSYLLYQDIDKSCYFNKDDSVPSQFIRRLYCQIISNEEEWNWRLHPNISRIKKIIKKYEKIKLPPTCG